MSSPDQPDQTPDAPAGGPGPAAEDLSWRRPAVVFLLLDRAAPTDAEVTELLHEVFDGSYPVGADAVGGAPTVRIEDAVVAAQPLDGPVGDGEPARYTGELAIWNGGEDVVAGHRSHIVIGAERVGGDPDGPEGEPEPMDPRLEALRCELAVAHVTAALTALPGAVAVYLPTAAATLPAVPYRDIVTSNPIPVPAMIGVRAGWFSEGRPYVYTSGLGRFGRPDMERFADGGHPGEVYAQMCDLLAFSLGSGTIFQPGQLLEVAEGSYLRVDVGVSEATGWQVLQLHAADSPAAPGDQAGRGGEGGQGDQTPPTEHTPPD